MLIIQIFSLAVEPRVGCRMNLLMIGSSITFIIASTVSIASIVSMASFMVTSFPIAFIVISTVFIPGGVIQATMRVALP